MQSVSLQREQILSVVLVIIAIVGSLLIITEADVAGGIYFVLLSVIAMVGIVVQSRLNISGKEHVFFGLAVYLLPTLYTLFLILSQTIPFEVPPILRNHIIMLIDIIVSVSLGNIIANHYKINPLIATSLLNAFNFYGFSAFMRETLVGPINNNSSRGERLGELSGTPNVSKNFLNDRIFGDILGTLLSTAGYMSIPLLTIILQQTRNSSGSDIVVNNYVFIVILMIVLLVLSKRSILYKDEVTDEEGDETRVIFSMTVTGPSMGNLTLERLKSRIAEVVNLENTDPIETFITELGPNNSYSIRVEIDGGNGAGSIAARLAPLVSDVTLATAFLDGAIDPNPDPANPDPLRTVTAVEKPDTYASEKSEDSSGAVVLTVGPICAALLYTTIGVVVGLRSTAKVAPA